MGFSDLHTFKNKVGDCCTIPNPCSTKFTKQINSLISRSWRQRQNTKGHTHGRKSSILDAREAIIEGSRFRMENW